jgi:hypothetical protein
VGLLAGSAVIPGQQPFFRVPALNESVGRIVEDQDGVAGAGLEPILNDDAEVFLGVFLGDDFAVILLQNRMQWELVC